MTEISDLVYIYLSEGCKYQNCQNIYCKSSYYFYTISQESLKEKASEIANLKGPLALCLPSLKKISAIFSALTEKKTFAEAWSSAPIEQVVICESPNLDFIVYSISCNLCTPYYLNFVLPEPYYTKDFFNQLIQVELNSYSALQMNKMIKMTNQLTIFINKLINAAFYITTDYNEQLDDYLLYKLLSLPDCVFYRNYSAIVVVAKMCSQYHKEQSKKVINVLFNENGIYNYSNLVLSACNYYISVNLSSFDRPNHTISVVDFIPKKDEVLSVFDLMSLHYYIYYEQLSDGKISGYYYSALAKLLANDFINSSAYNITPDTDYYLISKKGDEVTDISVLPPQLQAIILTKYYRRFDPLMFSLLNYPFLLNAGTKSYIFKYDATQNIPHISMLKVRRYFIVEDTLAFMYYCPVNWTSFYARALLRLPIKVVFDGEEGVDAGGLSNEFFSLVIKELFSEKYHLFKFKQEENLYFVEKFPMLEQTQEKEYFSFSGVILGLALTNSVILDIYFPILFYKLLLGYNPSFSDLYELDQQLYLSLQQISNYAGDMQDLCLDFTVREDVFGEIIDSPLKLDGKEVVTSENKAEYVKLRQEYECHGAINKQMGYLREGFMYICDCATLDLLESYELYQMLYGEPNLDFFKLYKICRYEEPYNAQSQIIQWFWHIVLNYNEQEKSNFCQFVFGTRRAPAGGLERAKFGIQKNGEDDIRLPTSHTCFGILMLPQYSSEDVLKEKLGIAIVNNEGFGLQ